MFRTKELEARLQRLEDAITACIHREDALLQRFDELRELNDHLLSELRAEREAYAEYRSMHPADPEDEIAAEKMRQQFDEIMGYNGPRYEGAESK